MSERRHRIRCLDRPRGGDAAATGVGQPSHGPAKPCLRCRPGILAAAPTVSKCAERGTRERSTDHYGRLLRSQKGVLSGPPHRMAGRPGSDNGVDMARVEGEIVISRPVEEVFDFVADERNEPRYNPRMRVVEQISEGPIGVGTRFRTELETMGRTMPMVVEFTGFERPWRLGSVTRTSMMETEGALTFESVPGGTRMCWSWDVRPHAAMRVMAPVVGVIGRRQEQSIWGNLKRLLESGGAGS